MKFITIAIAASLLATTAAWAADLPQMQAPSAPAATMTPPAYNWTGFYAGIFGGATTGTYDYPVAYTDPPDTASGDFSVTGGGMIAGAQVGADVMLGNQFVLGAYADIATSQAKAEIAANFNVPGLVDGSGSISSKLTWLGTLQGRAGFAMDRALFYAHGGAAFGHTDQTIDYNITTPPIGSGTIDLASADKRGYVVGAGLEYALTDNITIKTEYSYYNFGTDRLYSANDLLTPGDTLTISEKLDFQAVTAGATIRF